MNFDYQKATQAINYFSRKSDSLRMNKMKVIKLIWLADRYHLRKYGRPVLGDEYNALPYGPVGSTVKDLAENSGFLAEEEKDYSSLYIKPINQYTVESIQQVDTDVFSETDIEALEFAFDRFGNYDQFDLSKMSHEFPEWKKFENSLVSRMSTRERMDYLDFFLDTESEVDDAFKDDPNGLALAKSIFIENYENSNGI